MATRYDDTTRTTCAHCRVASTLHTTPFRIVRRRKGSAFGVSPSRPPLPPPPRKTANQRKGDKRCVCVSSHHCYRRPFVPHFQYFSICRAILCVWQDSKTHRIVIVVVAVRYGVQVVEQVTSPLVAHCVRTVQRAPHRARTNKQVSLQEPCAVIYNICKYTIIVWSWVVRYKALDSGS